MPQTALDNPLVIAILGLLVEEDRHQYAVLSEVRSRYPFLRAKTGSVYTLIANLARRGLVEIRTTKKSDRPRVRITAGGVRELSGQVEEHLRHADTTGDQRFLIALAYLGILEPERAVEVLDERAKHLAATRADLVATLDAADGPELHVIEGHFVASRLDHDRRFFATLAQRVRTRDLPWPEGRD